MRVFAILCVLSCAGLAACSSDPRSFGITGPGVHTVAEPQADPGNGYSAGVPQSGTTYGPTYGGPSGGSTGFWGYND
jgi:hypothetical protein